MILTKSTVEILSLWNTDDTHKTENHDFSFIETLLVGIFGVDEIAVGKMDENKMEFVRNVFAHRVNNDPDQTNESFDTAITSDIENGAEKSHDIENDSNGDQVTLAESSEGFISENIPMPINFETEDAFSGEILFTLTVCTENCVHEMRNE